MNKLDVALEQADKLFESQLEDKNKKYAGNFFPSTIKCLKVAASRADQGRDGVNTVRVNEICENAVKENRVSNDDLPDVFIYGSLYHN